MKIAVGSDHGGFALKEAVKKHLEAKGIEVEDFGCYSTESVDYAVYGAKVAHCVADGKADYGVLVCSTGIGISMAANKVKGIRCAHCADCLQAEPDTCWIKVAGQSPEKYVEKYTDRCPIVHLKDFIKEGNPKSLYKLIGIETEDVEGDTGVFQFRPVGFGQQIWEPILNAAVKSNAKWVVVEQDEHNDIPSLECARRSREYLKILGW